MIRANLLPRSRERLRAFGLQADAEVLRMVASGCAAVVLAALATFGIESIRLGHIATEAAGVEAILDANAPRRARAQAVAFDVARLEAVARRAAAMRRSGNDAARDIARLGNAIPGSVALDDLTSEPATIRLRGTSSSLDRIGETIASLGRAFPGMRTAVGDITERRSETADTLSFTAEIGPVEPRAVAPPARHLAPTDLAR